MALYEQQRERERERERNEASMGKRRRVTRSLDEADRKMYKTFSSAANAVSLLYTQVRPPPRPSFVSFHARTREREALGLKGEYGGPAGRAVSVGSLFPAGNERGNQGLPFRARIAKNMLSDANSVFSFFFSRFAQAQAQQKQSYLAGVQDALEKVLEWVEANKNIQTCAAQRQALTNFLHQELDAVESETPEPVPVDLKVRKESRPLPPSETIPHRTGN